MKMRSLLQTAALLVVTVPILGCGESIDNFDHCESGSPSFCWENYEGKLSFEFSPRVYDPSLVDAKKVNVLREIVLYNMQGGQYTEIETKDQINVSYSKWQEKDTFIFTPIDDPWGLTSTENADCAGLRITLTHDDGREYTVLGWRDDSNTALTIENSVQGVAYIKKGDKFFRSTPKPLIGFYEKLLYRNMVFKPTLGEDFEILVRRHDSFTFTYRHIVEDIEGGEAGSGDYVADPDPSQCNIINSPEA